MWYRNSTTADLKHPKRVLGRDKRPSLHDIYHHKVHVKACSIIRDHSHYRCSPLFLVREIQIASFFLLQQAVSQSVPSHIQLRWATIIDHLGHFIGHLSLFLDVSQINWLKKCATKLMLHPLFRLLVLDFSNLLHHKCQHSLQICTAGKADSGSSLQLHPAVCLDLCLDLLLSWFSVAHLGHLAEDWGGTCWS